MTLDHSMTQFRLASRELFNGYFRVEQPYENGGWLLDERFSIVEEALFEQLVSEPHGLPEVKYGTNQPGIGVTLKGSDFAPIMVNRAADSGYWDHPLREVTKEVRLSFLRFFDWDLVGVRDNQYIRVVVDHWPSHPEVEGFHALIGAQYIAFTSA
jgi:hypothetical protein